MKEDLKNDDNIPAELTGSLLNASAPIHPGTSRANRILNRVRERIVDQPAPSISDLLTVAVGDGQWIEPLPGNRVKMLRVDEDTQSFLVRLEPGTRFPAHSHPEDEETFVRGGGKNGEMEGEVLFGDQLLSAGDYHLARRGSFHEEIFCEKGCLMFIRAGTEQTTEQ